MLRSIVEVLKARLLRLNWVGSGVGKSIVELLKARSWKS